MKSVIIRQNGIKIIHIKRTKNGATSEVLDGSGQIEIKIILKDNSIINLK